MKYSKVFSILLVRIFFISFENFVGLKFQCFLKIIEFMSKLSRYRKIHTHYILIPIWHLLIQKIMMLLCQKSLQVGCCTSSLGGQLFLVVQHFGGWVGGWVGGGGYPTMNLDQYVTRWWNLSLNQCWADLTFCKNRPVPFLSWCYENLIGSLIYIYWADENRSGYQKTNFKLTRFLDRAILIYRTTTGFQNLIIKKFSN